ncbi:uncharacterized protein Z518_03126 [Rhinocladiella mackenziei CBS 650.93]|uniref:Zn(2)-C6 fungal-type domain-containing protein n=1 Tax=Rhinocladiella mackenziei CBS 650.93 TaxID=1442369 RepID=A0A0D2JGM6_9EURO|nr:uncharacterized protein Z518_03126 [Rhinocladiella mackenziei CBS 650.93]KIX08470.1 hypothetical protein Z518_03126 [Rhinocladiella mackenziei CBS 650.93]
MSSSSCSAAGTLTGFSFIFDSRPGVGHGKAPKRTNSLGWAATDCHTCQSNRRQCDRRRPRCDTCTHSGVICGGFSQRLDWQPGIASRGKWSGKTFPSRADGSSNRDRAKLRCVKSFTFVQGSRRKRRMTIGADSNGKDSLKSPQSTLVNQAHCLTAHEEESADVVVAPHVGRLMNNPFQLSSRVLEMLDFYRWKFAIVTLTYHVQINPWQMCLPMAFDNPCLMDTIMALGLRYRARISKEAEDLQVLELKERALSSFRANLETAGPTVLIGTILALVGLDYAESGYSDWSVHFQGAHSVIRAAGGIGIAEQDSALQTQIAMLVWYDVTSSLISRRGPIFPRQYVEALTAWRMHSNWTLLALNGFPDELFGAIYDLASKASRGCDAEEVSELERHLSTVQFDAPNGEILFLLNCWRLALLLYCERAIMTQIPCPDQVLDGVGLDDRGTVPSFQHASRGSPRSTDLCSISPAREERRKFLAEEIIWLVRELPPDSAVQKQCLIPVTLAACEIGPDIEQLPFRIMAEEYCRRWSDLSGLRAFDAALGIMEMVWQLVDKGLAIQNVWWGELLHSATRSPAATELTHGAVSEERIHNLSRECLLG